MNKNMSYIWRQQTLPSNYIPGYLHIHMSMYVCVLCLSGGQLVLQMGGMNEFGEWSGGTRHATNLWENLNAVYLELLKEGKITKVRTLISLCKFVSENKHNHVDKMIHYSAVTLIIY